MDALVRNINLDVDPTQWFEPGMFSIPELHFLLEHCEEPPVAAFDDFDPDDKKFRGVMRARIEPFMARLHDLQTLQTVRKVEWAGFASIRASIERFLLWHDRSLEIARRSQGQFVNPSMFQWDDTGKPHKYATDADSGEMVRSEILGDGSRVRFGVRLQMRPEDVLTASLDDVMPWVRNRKNELVATPDKLIESTTGKIGFIRCPICEHTEEFNKSSRQAMIGARGRMSRHMKTSTIEVNRHRLLHTKTFK